MLSDVYSPTIDNTNVETLQYVVTDGQTFTDLQSRDMTYTVRSTDESGMACRVTSTAKSGQVPAGHRLRHRPRPGRRRRRARGWSRPRGTQDLKVYVRYDATINGNGGGGSSNGGADDAVVDAATTALVSSDPDTETNAANRDYAVPLYGALRADRPFLEASSGLRRHRQRRAGPARRRPQRWPRRTTRRSTATSCRRGRSTSGRTGGSRSRSASARRRPRRSTSPGKSAHASFDKTKTAYEKTWQKYDKGLNAPPKTFPGLSKQEADRLRSAYWLSANVLKASEDKTFPGAVVASLASPWGQAVSAGDTPGGKAVYFGSYREVFARDLYESFTGLMAAGDLSDRASHRALPLRAPAAGRRPVPP